MRQLALRMVISDHCSVLFYTNRVTSGQDLLDLKHVDVASFPCEEYKGVVGLGVFSRWGGI